jgi:hypothetical protein
MITKGTIKRPALADEPKRKKYDRLLLHPGFPGLHRNDEHFYRGLIFKLTKIIIQYGRHREEATDEAISFWTPQRKEEDSGQGPAYITHPYTLTPQAEIRTSIREYRTRINDCRFKK